MNPADTENGKCGRAPKMVTIFRNTVRKAARSG
jgi:hypothetical protein